MGTIKAQLADGRTLEFPEGTPDSVIDETVKKEMGLSAPTSSAPIPEGGSAPISTTSGTAPEPPTMVVGDEPPVKPEESLGGVLAREVPPVAGGMVGGLAAGAAGVGMLPVAGAVAAGAAAGEAYKQIGQHLSGSLDAPKTAIEAAKRIAKFGAREGAFEVAGGLLMKGFGKMLSPLKNKMMEGSSEVIDLLKDKIKPIVLTPSEATESRVLDLLQNVTEASLIGGSKIQDFKVRRLKFFDDFADSLIDEFGKRTDPADLGNLFVTAINNARAVHRKAANILYNSVKAGRRKTLTKPMKNFAAPLAKKAAKLGGVEAKNAGDDLIGVIMELPDKLSFKEAVELRSRLLSRIDEFSVVNRKAPAIGKAKKLISILDKSITKSLKEEVPSKAAGKGRVFYRGTGGEKLDPVFEVSGDEKPLWIATTKKEASEYGPKVEKIISKPGTKILYEGSDEFKDIMKSFGVDDYTNTEPMEAFEFDAGMDVYQMFDKVVKIAKEKGFDAVSFFRESDIGTVVINRKAFTSAGPPKLYHGSNQIFEKSSDMPKGHRGYFLTDSKKVAEKFGKNVHEGTLKTGDIFDARNPEHVNKFMEEFKRRFPKRSSVRVENMLKRGNHAFYEDTRTKFILEDLGYKGNWQTENGKNVYRMFSRDSFDLTPPTTKQQSPLEAWRIANRFYKDGQKKFNNTMLRRLVKMADDTGTGAEMIAPSILKPGRVSTVQKVKVALKDSPDTWNKLQGFFVQYLMNKSTNVDGELVGKRLINNISGKPNSFGEPMLREILSDRQVKTLKTFARAIQLTQQRQAQGAGKVLIQLTQAGAVGSILTGRANLPAATITFAPAVLSKMMLNPTVTKILTSGISIPAKSPQAAGILARLTAAAWRVENETKKNK